MIKTLNNIFKQDKEKFVVPKGVQDCIPVMVIYDDGIFKVGKDKYSKSFKFTDINYAVASREDKEGMFLEYSELLNSLDSGATTKITIAGSMAVEDEGTKIVVYDYDGNQLLKLGGEDISSPDKLGSITGMAETENGFVAADGNMREIQFWAKDGTHVGAISTEDIFGVSYPWLEDMQLLDDGSLLIMLTQERDDGSANELMFFRLTGF